MNRIVAIEGFEGYDDGPINNKFPWHSLSANVNDLPKVVSGSGAFLDTKGFRFAGANDNAVSVSLTIPQGGLVDNTTAADNSKIVFSVNMWIRIDHVTTATVNRPIIGIKNRSAATMIPLIGIESTAAIGLNLTFPSNIAAGTSISNPMRMNIATNQYYWLSVRFVLGDTFTASYFLNNTPIFDSVPITVAGKPLGANIFDSLYFTATNQSNLIYTIDDLIIESSNGTLDDWIGGFDDSGLAKQAKMEDLDLLSSKRIFLAKPKSNGTVNDWTSSDPEKENWEAAGSKTDFVEAMDDGLVDLYKFGIVNQGTNRIDKIDAISARYVSSKYQNVDPMVTNSDGTAKQKEGIVTRGDNSIISLQRTTPDKEEWTKVKFENTEFGQISI